MFSFWTCNCPIPHPAERAPWIPDEEWDSLLQRVHDLLGVGYDLGAGGARQERMIAQVGSVAGGREPGREVQRMPVAAQRRADGLRFSSVDDLLASDSPDDELVVRADMICTEVLHGGGRAMGVRLRPRQGGDEIEVRAEIVVVATGTVGTPKLLAGSGVDAGPALGANLFDHPAVGLGISLAAQVFTFPILAVHFFRFSPVGIVLNLIAVPAIAVLLLLGSLWFPAALLGTFAERILVGTASNC